MSRFLLSLLLTLSFAGSAWAVTPPKRMWWNSTRETRRQALKTANHVAWQQVVEDSTTTPNSSKTSNEDARTADTIRYQITGTTSYCDEAETTWDNYLKGAALPDTSRNFTREHFMEFAWGYAWLQDCIDSTEQANWITSMNYWTDLVLNIAPGQSWGTATSDVDELVGHYFGAITWALASADDNATKSAFILNHNTIGGLTATGTNKSTWRNAIKFYATVSSNGTGFESTQYDLGTLQLLMMGADAVNTLKNDGVDYFPEVTTLADEYARWAISLTTPARSDTFKYGSVESGNARSFFGTRLKPFINIAMELIGTGSLRPYLNHFQAQSTNSAECLASLGECYNWRGFLFGDPSSTSTNYRTGMNQATTDTTRGYMSYHNDWSSSTSSAVWFACPNNTFITGHKEAHFCTWDLYRDDAWAVTHIVGYDGTTSSNVPADKNRFFNTMMLGNLASPKEVRAVVATDSASDFAYLVGTAGGNMYYDEVTSAPNRYVHEWTRSYIYLPSTDASSDWVGIVDRLNVDDPTAVLNNDSYKQSSGCPSSGQCDQTAVDAGGLRKVWALHAPSAPTISGDNVSWTNTTANPDYTVKLTIFRPTETNRTVTASQQTSVPSSTETAGPGQWKILLSETPNTKWSMFVNNVSVYPTTSPTTTLITTSDQQTGETCGAGTAEAIGYRITRTGHNDYDVMFNAKQACDIPNTDTSGTITWSTALPGIVNQNRLRTVSTARFPTTAGYTYTSPAGSTSTRKVLIADLDPTLTWTATVDAGAAQSLGVSSSSAMGELTVSGSGAHTIVVIQGGSAPAGDTTDPTVSITAPVAAATVSGTVSVTATASDNVGVVGVQFKLDGSNLGSEDTGTPYEVAWNTLSASNASHSLTAVARDAAGNDTTSSAVAVTVSNTTPGSLLSVVSTTGSGTYTTGTLAVGQALYTDRTYTVSTLPSYLTSLEYVRTANNDRLNADVNYLALGLSEDAALYVLFNGTDANIPSWLDSTWTLRADNVDTTDNDGDLRKVYSKVFEGGTITLGGKNYAPNSAGTESNYFVAAADIFVEVTAPASLATVSGASVSLTADVGDTASVSGVQFLVDSANQGAEDTSAAYGVTWDSTAVGNGTHTVGALMRLSDGTTYAAQTISVTVNNVQADVTAPVISSLSSGTPGQTSATITWTTDEGASGYVEYGLTTSYGSSTTLNATLNTSHSHSLTSLTAGAEGSGVGTTYYFKVHSTDQAGNEATSTDSFTTAVVPDTTDPVLSSIVGGATATTTATLTWTTDESSDSQAEVRTSAGAIVGTATHTDATDVTSHSLSISSLTAATAYYFAVRSEDAAGNISDWSATGTFTTPAASDVTAPTISTVEATVVDTETATITYVSSETCDTEVRYGGDTDYADTNSPATNSSDVVNHSITLTTLSPDSTYHYQVRCTDPSNNVSDYSTDATFQTPTEQVSTVETINDLCRAWLVQITNGVICTQ